MTVSSLRIALVAPRYSPYIGGVETHVARVAAGLATRGHVVEVLTQAHRRDLARREEIDGVIVRRFPVPLSARTYAFAPSLWAYLARHHGCYDIVHAHHYHALPALGAALTGCRPLVFTPHYHGAGHSRLRALLHVPYRHAGRRIFARARRVICNSEAEAALVCHDFPAVAGRLHVVYPGVDGAAFRCAKPYDETRTVILSVGRLEAYKNVHRAIAALPLLPDSFVLRVVGEGPARPALQDLTERLGVEERVEFLGRVDDGVLHRWLRTAAVYVSLSGHEAFGLSVVEALAAGARVLASDIPAYREIARMVPAPVMMLTPLDSDPATLAAAIRALAARAPIETTWPGLASWDDVTGRTEQIYDELLWEVRQ